MNDDTDNRESRQAAKLSAEFLNAFVDDELAPDEKTRALLEISRDEALSREVCELRKVRDLVQLAYRDLPAPSSRGAAANRPAVGLPIAASIALVIGMALGWVLHEPPAAPSAIQIAAIDEATTARTTRPAPAPMTADNRVVNARTAVPGTALPAMAEPGAVATPPAAPRQLAAAGAPAKVLIHVSRGDTAALAEALEEIEGAVRYYRDVQQRARIEVVINGDGLNLVRSDVTAFAGRIQRLQNEYDNLTFAACQNTIERLRREHGVTARLLPGVVVIDSGVARIMQRQQQGWAYIRV